MGMLHVRIKGEMRAAYLTIDDVSRVHEEAWYVQQYCSMRAYHFRNPVQAHLA